MLRSLTRALRCVPGVYGIFFGFLPSGWGTCVEDDPDRQGFEIGEGGDGLHAATPSVIRAARAETGPMTSRRGGLSPVFVLDIRIPELSGDVPLALTGTMSLGSLVQGAAKP